VAAAELVRQARGSHPVPGWCVPIVLHHMSVRSLLGASLSQTAYILNECAVYCFAVDADEFAELVASSGVPSDEIPELLETLHKWGLLLYFPRLGGVGELVAYVRIMLSFNCVSIAAGRF